MIGAAEKTEAASEAKRLFADLSDRGIGLSVGGKGAKLKVDMNGQTLSDGERREIRGLGAHLKSLAAYDRDVAMELFNDGLEFLSERGADYRAVEGFYGWSLYGVMESEDMQEIRTQIRVMVRKELFILSEEKRRQEFLRDREVVGTKAHGMVQESKEKTSASKTVETKDEPLFD